MQQPKIENDLETSAQFINRLRLCTNESGSLADLAEQSGITTRTLSNYLNGKTEPKLSIIKKIAQTCSVSEAWLLLGDTVKSNQSPPEDYTYHKDLRRAPHDKQNSHNYFSETQQSYNAITFSNAWIKSLGINQANTLIHRIDGDSMQPTFKHGDLLLVDTSINQITTEGIYLLSVSRFVLIKRIIIHNDHIALKNDNPIYADEIVKLNEAQKLSIMGRVRWHSRIV